MSKPVVHFEFWSPEPDTCSKFYSDVFEWDIKHIPEMNYHLVDKTGEGGIGGGIFKPQQGEWPAKLALYIDVEDLAPYRETIVAAGGKILVEEQEIPGVGSFCLFSDPDGRILGCWKQQPHGK
jgi:hypothetical protein